MKILIILSAICLVFASADISTAASGKRCGQCGMDIVPYSRMIVTYTDGTSIEVCSIRCAVENMEANKDKQVQSLMVADFGTGEMIDARTAVWVIGGSKEGVMTSVPKWAFAKEEDARKFIADYGGKVASFDEVLKSVKEELSAGGEHRGHYHGPGSQMIFNPAFSDEIYHTHPAGMWMVNYRFMHTDMTGLRAGTTDYNSSNGVGYNSGGVTYKYNYMMIPTDMTMDMHMIMLMYGITDRLTVMAMPSFVSNSMNMQMDMGLNSMGMRMIGTMPTFNTSGIGDTEVRGIYKIDSHFVGSLGLSIPTGDINQKMTSMGTTYRAPYDMQLGSGTYDLKPALTYSGLSEDAKWNWGAQAEYTYHTADNSNGWHFGNSFKTTAWLQREFGPAVLWVRTAYTDTDKIHGVDQSINQWNNPACLMSGMGSMGGMRQLQGMSAMSCMAMSTPDADPNNYGGQRVDAMFGVSLTRGPVAIGIEMGFPLYQYLNGLQLQTSWFVTVGAQVMF